MRSGSREQIEARTPTIRAPRPSTISTWSNHRPNNQRKRWTSLGIVAYLIRVEEAMNGRSCAGRLHRPPSTGLSRGARVNLTAITLLACDRRRLWPARQRPPSRATPW